MTIRIGVTCLLFSLGWAPGARAEPFTILPNSDLVFNVMLTTTGVFTCLRSIPCTGSGTNTITVGSGAETATLTFRGVETSFQAGNVNTLVNLGVIEVAATPGFTWPDSHPRVSIVNFSLSLTHDLPVPSTRTRTWGFGPGGEPDLALLQSHGGTYALLPTGPNPPGYHYTGIVYTFTPFPFTIPASGFVNINADVGAIPEPTTLLLIGSSLAGGAYMRWRRRRRA
jgi:hypothetical protein